MVLNWIILNVKSLYIKFHTQLWEVKKTAEILLYMYPETLCSCCRAKIVQEMGRPNMLTDKILQECLHDSNDDIREYAKNNTIQREE